MVSAEVQSATVSERDVGEEECVVNVEWSEAFVSCGGSLSQYVLSVTPPTPDCQSSLDCVVRTSSSQYTIPGSETQYSLTVGTLDYDITVRADVCDGSMTAESSVYNVNLTGELTLMSVKEREKVAVRICLYMSCTTLMMYSPYDGSLRSIFITWTPMPVSVYAVKHIHLTLLQASLSPAVEYTVLIDDGVGPTVRERVSSPNCNSTHCSHTILRGRGKLCGSAPSSSTPPAVTYEEVGVAREVKRSQDIKLTSNEAYGPVQSRDIQTTQNTAYGQVQL